MVRPNCPGRVATNAPAGFVDAKDLPQQVTTLLRIVNGCPDVDDARRRRAGPRPSDPAVRDEEGLAFDFTEQGQTIYNARSSAGWTETTTVDLPRANAARFGFRNLPSEAWHWSPSGR